MEGPDPMGATIAGAKKDGPDCPPRPTMRCCPILLATAGLLSTACGGTRAPKAPSLDIAEEAGGIPFFIAELAFYVQTVEPSREGPVRLDQVLEARIGARRLHARGCGSDAAARTRNPVWH